MKNYTTAPLPFQGQKRRFLKEFKEALNSFSPTATYVDLFGGSGFLSHTVKQYYPNAKVIYNDYDNYSYHLENVDKTNAIITDLRKILKDVPNEKRQIIELCDWMETNGYCRNPFDGSTTIIKGTQLTKNARYNDV